MTFRMKLSTSHLTINTAPIFLVGCPRSGTTWLQAMLSAHPHIRTGPETHFFESFRGVEKHFLSSSAGRKVGLSSYLSEEQFYTTMADCFWQVVSTLPAPSGPTIYFLEKTPQHGLYADFILRTFPSARFIHLIRDGREVAASLLRVSKSWGVDWAPKTIIQAIMFWKNHVLAARGISRKVQNPRQYIETRYEDLLQNPEYELTRLWNWLELQNDETLVSVAVDSNSMDTIKKTAHPFPAIPKGDYPEGFINSSSSISVETSSRRVNRILADVFAGEILMELGYEEKRILLPRIKSLVPPTIKSVLYRKIFRC